MVDAAKSRVRTAEVTAKYLAMIEGKRRTAGAGVAKTPYDYRTQVGGKELVVFEHMVINAMSYISPVCRPIYGIYRSLTLMMQSAEEFLS
jgi:hypothetical protein